MSRPLAHSRHLPSPPLAGAILAALTALLVASVAAPATSGTSTAGDGPALPGDGPVTASAMTGTTADGWATEHFAIYAGEPMKPPEGEITVEWATTFLDRLDTDLGRRREADLAWIASRYRDAGFLGPELGPVVPRTEGDTAYAVLLFPFTGSDSRDALSGMGGGYEAFPRQVGDCPPITSGWIAFNAEKPPARDGFFDTLAHELFHAVQAAYPYRRGCRAATWITEGTASAAGQYMYRQKFGRDHGVVSGVRSAQGLRPYHVPLHYERALASSVPRVTTGDISIEREHVGYATASFWRFLAEATGGLEYLHTLMSRPIRDDSPEGRLRWLQAGLQADPRFGGDDLYALYPEFVTEFASWGGARYPVIAEENFGGDLEAARERWLQLAFDGCQQIEVGPGETKKVRWIDFDRGSLNPVAARCVRVTYRAPLVETTPVVEAVHGSSDALDGVHLGVARESGPGGEQSCWQEGKRYRPGTPKCVLKVQHLKSTEGRWARSWNEGPIPPAGVQGGSGSGDTEKLYVLSNVRPDAPWDTEALDITFRVGLPATEITSGEAAGPPEESTIKKSESTERLAERAEAGDVSMEEAFEIASEMMDGVLTGPSAAQAYGAGGGVGLPVAPTELGSFSFVRGDGRRVSLQPMPREDGSDLAFGETGPLNGVLIVEGGDAMEMSTLCAGNEARVGQVVESTEDELVIRLATDICRFDPAAPTACQDGCPKVDAVDATLRLPAGWRYYATSAPEPVVTAGIEDYIRRFVDMDAPAFVAPRNEDDDRPSPGDGSTDPGDGGTGVAPEDPPDGRRTPDDEECDCSCREFERLTEAVQESAASGRPDLELVERLQACTQQCADAYAACRRR